MLYFNTLKKSLAYPNTSPCLVSSTFFPIFSCTNSPFFACWKHKAIWVGVSLMHCGAATLVKIAWLLPGRKATDQEVQLKEKDLDIDSRRFGLKQKENEHSLRMDREGTHITADRYQHVAQSSLVKSFWFYVTPTSASQV